MFCGDLVCEFKRIVGNPNFGDQFGKIVGRCMGVGYSLGVMRRSVCLVVGPIAVCGYGFLFDYAAMVCGGSDVKH